MDQKRFLVSDPAILLGSNKHIFGLSISSGQFGLQIRPLLTFPFSGPRFHATLEEQSWANCPLSAPSQKHGELGRCLVASGQRDLTRGGVSNDHTPGFS
jgi:hypothetical protein